ncbi:hypothetical protein UY286_04970 [Paenibacillus polymyxa]|nr:hypothetical protein [Paenibacillus polymyxa]MDY7989853.1 hypothetical protein [Paenibacillus polymyxa]MDY8116788.1 hypothetical protein [Paenibacillus polymyxa]
MSAKEQFLRLLLNKTTKEHWIARVMLSASPEVLKTITLNQIKHVK